MKQQYTVLQYIRKCSIAKIWYPLGCCLLILLLFICLPARSQLFPRLVTIDTELSSLMVQDDVCVNVVVADLFYTGYDYYQGSRLRGHYYYSLNSAGDHISLFVLPSVMGKAADRTISDKTIYGRLVPLDSNVYNKLLQSVSEEMAFSSNSLQQLTEPVLISEVDYIHTREIIYYAIALLALIISLFVFLRHLVYIFFPRMAPAYQRLRKYGDPEQIMTDVDRQLQEECLILTKDMALCTDYLIEFSEDISAIVPLKNVLWTYEHATLNQHERLNRRLTYTLHVVMENGDSYTFNNKWKEDVDIILQELSIRYPNFFMGYSDEHLQLVRHILADNKKEQQSERRKNFDRQKRLNRLNKKKVH